MAKKPDEPEKTPAQDGQKTQDPTAAAQPQLNVLGQYIKDLSFENPGAPAVLKSPGQNPQLQVSVNVNAKPFHDR